jgi:3-hydroxyacyl-[acyl-carrier-protein] dehydratase
MYTTDYLLLGSFFNIGTQTDEPRKLRRQILLNPHHAVFVGHFPGRPVVPGVCVLALVKDVLQQHLNKELLMRTCSNVKFMHPINPLAMPELELTVDFTPEDFFVDFRASIQHEQQALCRVAGRFQTDFL